MNVLVTIVAAVLTPAYLLTSDFFRVSIFTGHAIDITAYVIGSVIFRSLLLATFNLIQIAPLDGFNVSLGVLSKKTASEFAKL